MGCLGWSITEYVMHRFAGHRRTGLNFSRDHLQHHRDPGYFLPASKKAIRAVVIFKVLAIISSLAVGMGPGVAFASGFILAYGYYEWLHVAIHAHAPRNSYGRWARRHHLYHHFGDMRVNHGVTSPIWDMAFGTYVAAPVVKIPRKKADTWIKCAIDSAASDSWLEDYRLITAR